MFWKPHASWMPSAYTQGITLKGCSCSWNNKRIVLVHQPPCRFVACVCIGWRKKKTVVRILVSSHRPQALQVSHGMNLCVVAVERPWLTFSACKCLCLLFCSWRAIAQACWRAHACIQDPLPLFRGICDFNALAAFLYQSCVRRPGLNSKRYKAWEMYQGAWDCAHLACLLGFCIGRDCPAGTVPDLASGFAPQLFGQVCCTWIILKSRTQRHIKSFEKHCSFWVRQIRLRKISLGHCDTCFLSGFCVYKIKTFLLMKKEHALQWGTWLRVVVMVCCIARPRKLHQLKPRIPVFFFKGRLHSQNVLKRMCWWRCLMPFVGAGDANHFVAINMFFMMGTCTDIHIQVYIYAQVKAHAHAKMRICM